MKFFCLLLIAYIFSPLVHGQARSSFDFSIEANRSYRNLLSQDDYSLPVDIIGTLDRVETPLTNFGFGLHYSQRLSNCFLLRTGIEYQRLGFQLSQSDLRWGSEFDPSTGQYINDPSLPQSYTLKSLYRFYSVPMLVRYEIGSNRVQPFIEAGAAISLLRDVRSRSFLDNDPPTTFEVRDGTGVSYERVYVFARLQAGANYQLSHHWQLYGSFNYQSSLTNVNQNDTPINMRLYSLGLTAGIRKMIN